MKPEKTAEAAKLAEQTQCSSLRSLRPPRFLLALFVLVAVASRASAQSVTYTHDVAPLIADRCGMCHHPGGSAPFSLLTYADAKRHAAQIVSVTAQRFMPPWKADPSDGPFVGQHPLSEGEIALLRRWSDTGAPEGDDHQSSVVSRQSSVVGRQSSVVCSVRLQPDLRTLRGGSS